MDRVIPIIHSVRPSVRPSVLPSVCLSVHPSMYLVSATHPKWLIGFLCIIGITRSIRSSSVHLSVRPSVYGWTDRQTDGRTDGRTDGQKDRRTEGRTDRRTDGQKDGRTEGRTDRMEFIRPSVRLSVHPSFCPFVLVHPSCCPSILSVRPSRQMDRWRDRWTDRQTNGQKDIQMDGRIDGRTEAQVILSGLLDFYVFIYSPPRGFAGGRIGTRFLHPRGRGK
jgi:hypothetical protein